MPVDVRLLSVEDYHRMAAAGIFRPGERVGLIAGQVVKISAKGTAHSAAITRTEDTAATARISLDPSARPCAVG